MKPEKKQDAEFMEHVIEGVRPSTDGYELQLDGSGCFWCPKESPIVPTVGMIARLYGKGFGYTVRGLDINGFEVFYRTAAEEDERHRQWCRDEEAKRQKELEENLPAMDAKYAALPEVFRLRIDKFRGNNPTFRRDFESYEMFCCEQAVVIADALKTSDAVRKWADLPFEEQKASVPGLGDGHSGNTFGCACSLAVLYLDRPDGVGVREDLAGMGRTKMSDRTKEYAAKLLEELMSEISEDHYCAGWMGDLEYDLWRMMASNDHHYGLCRVSDESIKLLRQYAEDAGGWQTCVGFMPMDQWLSHFADFETWHQSMVAELESTSAEDGMRIVRRHTLNRPKNPLPLEGNLP